MKQDELEQLKKTLDSIGTNSGKSAGEKAGIDAASKIDIPSILEAALSEARKASDEAKALSQAKEQESHAAALQSMTIKEAKLAGKRTGAKTAKDAADFCHGVPEVMQHVLSISFCI